MLRPRVPLAVKGRLHVATEGRLTERDYISDIRMSLRIPKELVVLLRHECTDPLSLVEQVLGRISGSDFDGDLDEAWVVFDVDEHRQNPVAQARFARAICLAEANGVNVAYSNPCVELWLLLHFESQTAELNRGQAREKLKKYLPSYDKALTEKELALLRPANAVATARAGQLLAKAARPEYKEFPFLNPTTRFHVLIERIKQLK